MRLRLLCVSWDIKESFSGASWSTCKTDEKNPIRRYLERMFLWVWWGAGYSEYDADYVFATVQTLNRDDHLMKYQPDAFDCIIFR